MVTDLSQPVGMIHFPQFGPFADEEEAQTFADQNEHYWAHIFDPKMMA